MSTYIPENVQACIKNISEPLDANLFLYSADISQENADLFVEVVRSVSHKRENAVLVLATYGGDPDAAYRITRFLKQAYKTFTLFVFGYCKSAGTLIAIGADEIVISDLAELGPLDVQVLKENDFRRSSGLDLQKALDVLRDEVFKAFEVCFIETVYRSEGVVNIKLAADIASSMAVGLLTPIAGQIDPLRLGELSRSMEVAYEYGIRLNPSLGGKIKKLVDGYPSHSFVIDRQEAKGLFPSVREPSNEELILEQILEQCVRSPTSEPLIFSLDEFIEDIVQETQLNNIQDGDNDEKSTNDDNDAEYFPSETED
ncbi:hypothetical protein [Oscillatoria sp. FACHB-1406]|uniref:SDH family Clp fold serine proteinase n=1 Tax=Oscillatoria sp. FACHB-1406 TaxID=2692846 RepID=UPI00168966AD|nr:hypothetical protein [Oscillatoria sp. FACHB-1406]MBD2579851.1 hypothetical protein [Oscillatoria sp. FACHB-1406]